MCLVPPDLYSTDSSFRFAVFPLKTTAHDSTGAIMGTHKHIRSRRHIDRDVSCSNHRVGHLRVDNIRRRLDGPGMLDGDYGGLPPRLTGVTPTTGRKKSH